MENKSKGEYTMSDKRFLNVLKKCSVFCAVLAGVGAFTACGGNTESSAALTTEVIAAETTAAPQGEPAMEQTTLNPVSIPVKEDGNWDLGGRYGAKYTVNINNTLGRDISDWKINVYFSQPVHVSDLWNGQPAVNNQLVTITAVDYNRVIQPGDSFEVGFVADFPVKPQILASALYVKGEKVYIDAPVTTTSVTSTTAATAANTQPVKAETYTPEKGTPVAQNGKLSVKGTQLVNSQGNPVILQGVSTHGIAWFPQYVNKEAFATLRDTMNVDTIRLALYSGDNEGYANTLHGKVDEGVKYATELGMYVIIDWHILGNGNPNTDKEAAKAFFKEMSAKYCDYDNVLYEICNEPNGNVTWSGDIKPYAQEVIPIIRANDSDAVIIVGTPTWSQDVDIAANDPLQGENIMYTLHFYADTHRQDLRNKLETAYSKGLPIFVTEFGITDASGSGNVNQEEGKLWIDFLRSHGISYCCWNLSNKNEASALIQPSCSKVSGWEDADLSQQGKWIKNIYNQTLEK